LVYYHYGARAPWTIWTRRREETNALAKGRRYLEEGRPRSAIQAVAVIGDESPFLVDALTVRGVAHAALENIGPARRALERAWRIRPESSTAKVLAAIYLSAYENERALQMLLEASRLEPGDFRPWYAMGEAVYLRLRRYDRAIEAFQKALKLLPGHPESRIGLVDALLKSHQPVAAESTLAGLLSERPHDPRVLTLAAHLAVEMGRDQDASHYLEQSLALDPNQREALILHARVQLRGGQIQRALDDATRASALEPNDLTALNLLGSIQSSLGLREQSAQTHARRREVERRNHEIEELMHQILERPNDPGLRCRLGQAAGQAGMAPLAMQCYQTALALAPECQLARDRLLELGFPPSRLPPQTDANSANFRRY
jgi:tetratricopeptide (TPR) repeat protein